MRTEQDGEDGHEVEHDDGEAGGKVGDAGGGVGEAVEEVETAIEEGALAGPEHLEVPLGPARALLERLLRDVGRLTDGEVLLHVATGGVRAPAAGPLTRTDALQAEQRRTLT